MRSDHLATWNEVREALAFLSLDGFELDCDCNADTELGPEKGNEKGSLDDFAWLALASEVQDSRCN
ncbi:MAG: hypothetical protein ACYDCG_05840 [Candidatus Acidiferrales bacterium]